MSNQTSNNHHSPLAEKVIAELRTPSPATALYEAAREARAALVDQLTSTAAEWGAVSEKAIIYATNHPTVVALDAALKAWEAMEIK